MIGKRQNEWIKNSFKLLIIAKFLSINWYIPSEYGKIPLIVFETE